MLQRARQRLPRQVLVTIISFSPIAKLQVVFWLTMLGSRLEPFNHSGLAKRAVFVEFGQKRTMSMKLHWKVAGCEDEANLAQPHDVGRPEMKIALDDTKAPRRSWSGRFGVAAPFALIFLGSLLGALLRLPPKSASGAKAATATAWTSCWPRTERRKPVRFLPRASLRRTPRQGRSRLTTHQPRNLLQRPRARRRARLPRRADVPAPGHFIPFHRLSCGLRTRTRIRCRTPSPQSAASDRWTKTVCATIGRSLRPSCRPTTTRRRILSGASARNGAAEIRSFTGLFTEFRAPGLLKHL